MAEQHWRSAADVDYDTFLLTRPLSPILTIRATRETPHLGKEPVSVPRTGIQLLQSYQIATVDNQFPSSPSIREDEVLGNKPALDPDTHRSITELIQSVPSMSGRDPSSSFTKPFDDLLRSDSPPIELPEPEALPVFSRAQRPGRSVEVSQQERISLATSLASTANLPWLTPVAMKEEDEDDIANENLVLMDGWHAFKTPSSPLILGTPSLANTSSDIDETFMPSSPVPGLGEEFMPMEDYQIPRTERMGGLHRRPSLPGEGKKLSSFLSPFLRPVQNVPKVVLSPKSQPSSPHMEVTMSMLGQPPTALDAPSRERGDIPSSDDTVVFAIKTIEDACGVKLEDDNPSSFVLKEKLDEKDSMLMDVPNMRPPNMRRSKEHSSDDLKMPVSLADLLAPCKTNGAQAEGAKSCPATYTSFLKKVKGLQPLQIELSWIPFKYGRTVPTDEQVADVANDPCPELTKCIDLPQDVIVSKLASLLDESMAFSSQPKLDSVSPSMTSWLLDRQFDEDPKAPTLDDDLGLILPMGDRCRLAGLPNYTWEGEDTGNSDKENEFNQGSFDLQHSEHEHERPIKRVRFHGPTSHYDDSEDTTAAMPCSADITCADTSYQPEDRAAVVPRPQSMDIPHDDSGVFLTKEILMPDHPEVEGVHSGSSFVQLTFEAEGFDGPIGDGNLFPDMHPVFHYEDYAFNDPLQFNTLSTAQMQPMATIPIPPDGRTFGDGWDHDDVTTQDPVTITDSFDTHIASGQLSDHVPSAAPDERVFTDLTPQLVRAMPATANLRTDARDSGVIPSAGDATVPSFTARQSLVQFFTLCGKVLAPHSDVAPVLEHFPETNAHGQPAYAPVSAVRWNTPAELIDDRTLVLPEDYEPPSTVHRYMASMGMAQKRTLIRTLSSYCSVNCAMRENLGQGVDATDVQLILDCDTAVLFFSVEMLPSRGDDLCTLLARLSWQYTRLLVVLECYPSSWDYRGDKDSFDRPSASAWSPPVVKAVQKLRRALSIAEGMQAKRVQTVVEYAFANSVEEAAALARSYGDAAEARDTTCGAVWGDRLWLTDEEHDGEYDLCGVPGMNYFAASLLLSRISLEDFLEKSADARLSEFGELIGMDRITRFNDEMVRRLEIMQLPPSSPLVGDSSSLNSVPYIGDSDMDLV
ncbi:hypothetical protein C8Q74DRAFT_1364412 [Fomes fomentarius]|nr:hypothetical protein C8Q74DRAFT_1364412 [Fomes fomentarius]